VQAVTKPPVPKEAQIQRAIMARLQFLGVLAVHIPNEGKRSARAGQRLKGEGMRPGWPDIAAYQNGRHALLEVKRPGYRPSAVSDSQKDCHALLDEHGFPVAIVTSQDEAIDALRIAGFRV